MSQIPVAPLEGQALVDAARAIAERAHAGQFRADKIRPYIEHPAAVVALIPSTAPATVGQLSEAYFAKATALAWIHDVVEDSAPGRFTFESLEAEGLGFIVPSLKLLTHFKDGDTYLTYILRIKESGDLLAKHVKLADMTANLADVAHHPSKAARKGLQTKYELARYILLNR